MTPKTYNQLREERFNTILKKREKELNLCLQIIHKNTQPFTKTLV